MTSEQGLDASVQASIQTAATKVTNIGYPLSSAAVFGMPRMARSRVMGGRFGGEVGRFLLALEEIKLLPSPQLPPRIY